MRYLTIAVVAFTLYACGDGPYKRCTIDGQPAYNETCDALDATLAAEAQAQADAEAALEASRKGADGSNGQDGAAGSNGSNGQDGASGSNGSNGQSCSVACNDKKVVITCGESSVITSLKCKEAR